jgi:hypothetical protein
MAVQMKRGRGRPKGSKNKSTLKKMLGEMESLTVNKKVRDKSSKFSDSEIVDMIRERFDVMHQFSVGATHGNVRGMIVSGAPGVGKSHTIEWVMESTALRRPDFKYTVVKGAMTGVNLYKLLWRYRHNGNVIILDDCDSIFFDEDGMSLLKAAVDSGTKRKICWFSESHALKEEGIDTEFEYNGTMIFITNADFQRIVDDGKSKLAPHFEALISRSIYLDLKLQGRRPISLWVKHVVMKNNILKDKLDCSAYEQEQALDYLVENRDKLRTLSIREALKLGQMIKTNPNNWRRVADITLLKEMV